MQNSRGLIIIKTYFKNFWRIDTYQEYCKYTYNSHTIDFTVEQKVKITNYNHKTSNQQLQPNQNYPLHLTLVVTEWSEIRGRQNFELSH